MVRTQKNYGAAIAQIAACLALFFAAVTAQTQTLTVLHTFTGGADGYEPYAGVTLDQQGRIYGTTIQGGLHDDGVVFRLAREGQRWALSPIYSFGSQKDDGVNPVSRVVFGPGGLLYGTTSSGGSGRGGTVFSLKPPATACKAALCPWVETILYNFTGGADGGDPLYGDLSFDQAGNIYGTTAGGGSSGEGVVFKLARSGSGWTESVLWNFTGGSDGGLPVSGVIFDSAGNLYGTTGNFPPGTVYELSPTQSGWSETTLYSFTSHTGAGSGGLIMDAHGNLFGITGGLDGGNGAAYELMPQNGSWSFTLLQNFGNEYLGTLAAPTFDSHGSLYGPVPTIGGEFTGEIFQLTPSGDQWIYRSFYTFNGSTSGVPLGAVTFDASGNMYGTGIAGGSDDDGTVWEITP
ncbi:MAG: choice-of-anchor tandem repeat GloVer-containing protein [Candidatus Korobacteraceae bacterium]